MRSLLPVLPTVLVALACGAGCTLVGYDPLNVDLQSSEEGGSLITGGTVLTGGGGSDIQGTGGVTGGVPSSGGTEGSGAIQATGGVIEDSGVPDAGGGMPVSGGTPVSGGAPASGGADAAMPDAGSGGDASGGVASGGVASGGVASGGVVSGGVASGGVASGGVASGGVASGGVASGGVATGGVASGGVASGGVLGSGGTPDPVYQSVLHRYDFSEVGTAIVDRAGDLDAVLYDDVPPNGEGFVHLDGVDDYLEFPSNMLSPLDVFTLALWVRWDGGVCDQSLLTFGSHEGPPEVPGPLVSTLGMGPHSCDGYGGAGAIFMEASGTNVYADSVFKSETAKVGATSFIALSVDRTNGRWVYYMDGLAPESALFFGSFDNRSLPSGFSSWSDVSNWIGRSQTGAQSNFKGAIDEFRVYDRVLSSAEVETMRTQGPDVVYDP